MKRVVVVVLSTTFAVAAAIAAYGYVSYAAGEPPLTYGGAKVPPGCSTVSGL